ncbi:MAG: tetratricopeptide repeat protein [Thermoanaerobaculales bacterium]
MRLRWPYLLFFFVVCALAATVSPAQNEELDDRRASLAQQIEVAGDSDRPRLLNELANLIWRQEPERAIEVASEALELATGQKNLRLTGDAHKLMGLAHLVMQHYADSLTEMREAEDLYRRLEENRETAKCLGYQGMALSKMGRLWPAIEVVDRALEMFRELGDEKGIAASTNNLGIYLERVGEYEQALRRNLESLEIERSLGRTGGIANNLNSIGNIHATLEDYERAGQYYQQALELFEQSREDYGVVQCLNNLGNTYENLDQDEKALEYFGRALEVARRLGIPSIEANPLSNMGIVHKKRGEFDQALDSYQQAAEIRRRLGEMANLAIDYQNIGEVYLLMERPSKALEYLNRSETIAGETGSNAAMEGAYRNLAEAHRMQGDYRRAYESLLRLGEVRDAHLDEEKSRAVTELQARYDADRRREEIELLTKDNQIQQLELGRTKLVAALLVAVTALVIGMAVLLLRRYRSLLAFWKKKVFIGPYRVGDEISAGGMGVVYRATNVLEPGKTVALKVIRDEYAGDAIQRKRFVNEGQIIDSINHPNIVTVYDRGEHNQRLYIAMEYLAGRTLAEMLDETARREAAVPLPRCLSIMGQLVDAVTSIHAMGIVHRDIKPNNVIVTGADGAEEQVKLLDFGAAKLDTMTTLTAAGELLGTVSYLAPECVRHQAPTPASDVFSLGVVFYELLTLEKPFPADDPAMLLRQLLDAEPVEPALFRLDLDGGLSELVMAMLHKDPSRRPAGEELVHRQVRLAATDA